MSIVDAFMEMDAFLMQINAEFLGKPMTAENAKEIQARIDEAFPGLGVRAEFDKSGDVTIVCDEMAKELDRYIVKVFGKVVDGDEYSTIDTQRAEKDGEDKDDS